MAAQMNKSDGGPFNPDRSWLAPLSPLYRWFRALVALGLAGAMAYWTITGSIFPTVSAGSRWVLAFAFIVLGIWRSRHWIRHPLKRRYKLVRIPVSFGERVRNHGILVIIGAFFSGFIGLVSFFEGNIDRVLPFLPVFASPAIVGCLLIAFRSHEWRVSPDALEAKAFFDAVEKHQKDERSQAVQEKLNSRTAKVFAATFLILTALYIFCYSDTADSEWMGYLCLAFGLYCIRDFVVAALFIGLIAAVAVSVVAGITALPVSAAIVLGAIIIANAPRK